MNPAAALAMKCAQMNSWCLQAKSLFSIPLSVFVLLGVYGTYGQLTLEKAHTSRLVFFEKREVFTETFAYVFHRKETNCFLLD